MPTAQVVHAVTAATEYEPAGHGAMTPFGQREPAGHVVQAEALSAE